jgi:EcsC protein family
MNKYEESALKEMLSWKRRYTVRHYSITNRLGKALQNRMNSLIPEKAHEIITAAIKNMVKLVLFGSEYVSQLPLRNETLENREKLVLNRRNFYKKAAAVSGAGTGAGGLLLGLADFPILISLKMKFLFETAVIYGFDVTDYRERLYILYIFQLAFSSQERSYVIFRLISHWDDYVKKLPPKEDSFDWRTFQQEYRDYIDFAKMLQLVPVIGAAAGAYANYRLMDKLGETAVNAYRMRIFKRQ